MLVDNQFARPGRSARMPAAYLMVGLQYYKQFRRVSEVELLQIAGPINLGLLAGRVGLTQPRLALSNHPQFSER
jgi:hypothetical protein